MVWKIIILFIVSFDSVLLGRSFANYIRYELPNQILNRFEYNRMRLGCLVKAEQVEIEQIIPTKPASLLHTYDTRL